MRNAANQKQLIFVGSILLVAGLVINQYSLAIFTPDGDIESSKKLIAIWLFQLTCVVVGLSIIVFRDRSVLGSVVASTFSWMVFTGFGLVAASIFLFAVFEFFPGLVPLALERGHLYYATKSRFVFDAELGFRNRPNLQVDLTFFGDMYTPTMKTRPEPITFSILHDENGHHNREVPIDPDIVMLGDSWLWAGLDWSDTFSARLEEASGKVTYNLGVGGYGPRQYLISFERYAAAKRPRIALFSFYEGNDIYDVGEFMRWEETGQSEGFAGRVARFSQGSFFDRFGVFTRVTFALIKSKFSPPPSLGSEVELVLDGRKVPASFFFRSDPRSPDELLQTSEWREVEKVLVEFKYASQAAGSLPVLVFLPSKQHVYAKLTGNKSDPKWLAVREQEIVHENNQEEAFSSLAERLQLELISLTPAFQESASEGALLYYPFDSHWNSAGRELGAKVVAGQLKTMNVLKR